MGEGMLHGLLKNAPAAKGTNGDISLYDRFSEVKEGAKGWLGSLDKNGFAHSERLEGYLDRLTRGLHQEGRLTYPEIFVLLCAVYMHDLGYLPDPTAGLGHEKRSHDGILDDPGKYRLGDFPVFGDGRSRVATAVALVSYGHARETERPLGEISREFADHAFEGVLNLRKLAAFLRLADEADDPYLRLANPRPESARSKTTLVEVGNGVIMWHWDREGTGDPRPFMDLLDEKRRLLATALACLEEAGAGAWHLVLQPEPVVAAPFMAKEPVETFVGREKDLEDLHAIMTERGEGAITGVVGTGGIGKTELARMYAKKYKRDYPAGIFWASLRGSSWRAEAGKILAALYPGLRQADPFPDDARAREEVCKRLNQRKALLVIDNVDEAEDIIKPGCPVLVTTRDRRAFGVVSRKAVKQLNKFSDEEGKKLLAEILGEPRVARDPAGASRIVEILGGMPLALEIAARHLEAVPDLSFPDYIGQVQGKVGELTLSDEEDKNVAASLEFSLEQLEKTPDGDGHMDIFEAGSVCAESGFTSRTLAGTVGADPEIVRVRAGELYRRCLFEFDEGTGRYAMHPLLRQLSEMRLQKDLTKQNRFRTNHCLHFLHFAEANNTNLGNLITEKDGLWQAMIQAHQIGKAEELLPLFLNHMTRPYQSFVKEERYEEAFGYLVETNLINIDDLGLSRELASLLEVIPADEPFLQDSSWSWLYTSLGLAYANLGEYQKAIDLYEKTLEIARRIGNVRGEGNALGNMGNA